MCFYKIVYGYSGIQIFPILGFQNNRKHTALLYTSLQALSEKDYKTFV